MSDLIQKIQILLLDCWRFRWWGLFVSWIAALAGWAVVAVIPNIYQADAEVYVDSESYLQPLLQGLAVDSMDFSEQLGLISTELLSRPVLERVAQEIGAISESTPAAEKSAVVVNLKEQISLQATRTHRPIYPEPPNLYHLSARDSDPERALAVVKSLLNIFVEDAIKGTRQDAGEATSFLESQIREHESRLAAAEKRLTEFKRANLGSLPEQGQGYYQRLQTAQIALEETELELRQEEYRKQSISQQLSGVSPYQRATAPDGTIVLPPLEERIQSHEERLDELLVQYTDNHPEVNSVRNSLERLRKQKDEQQEEERGSSNPMYNELMLQMGQVEATIAVITVRRDAYLIRVENLQNQIETLPHIEAQLGALNRDYDVTKANYNELLARLESAQMRTSADQTGQNVKFRIIEPPMLPAAPFFPNRILFSFGVFVLAAGAGLATALLIGQLRPVFSGVSELSKAFTLPVIGATSLTVASESGGLMRQTALFSAGTMALILLFALIVYSYIAGFTIH